MFFFGKLLDVWDEKFRKLIQAWAKKTKLWHSFQKIVPEDPKKGKLCHSLGTRQLFLKQFFAICNFLERRRKFYMRKGRGVIKNATCFRFGHAMFKFSHQKTSRHNEVKLFFFLETFGSNFWSLSFPKTTSKPRPRSLTHSLAHSLTDQINTVESILFGEAFFTFFFFSKTNMNISQFFQFFVHGITRRVYQGYNALFVTC